MNLAVGIFDLFTYTVPGALALVLLGYAATRLGWIDPAVLGQAPSLLVVIGGVVAAYLVGYLIYPLGKAAERLLPRRQRWDDAREFVDRVPLAQGRGFVQQDRHLLLSGIQLEYREVAMEVIRLRASSLMLRNAAPLFGLGALVGAVELFASGRPWFAGVATLLLAAGYAGLVVQARKMGHWANLKTLELCFWLPDIDDRFPSGQSDVR